MGFFDFSPLRIMPPDLQDVTYPESSTSVSRLTGSARCFYNFLFRLAILVAVWILFPGSGRAADRNSATPATATSTLTSAFFDDGPAYWDSRFGVPGVNGGVAAVVEVGDDVFVGGSFWAAGDVPANNIAVFNRSNHTWSAFGEGTNGPVAALAISQEGHVYAAGQFTGAGGKEVGYIARWDGEEWSAVGGGLDGYVNALAFQGNHLYVGGEFDKAGDVETCRIARWDGKDWYSLAGGMCGENTHVYSIGLGPEDELYAAGRFDTAGEVPTKSIAVWDGMQWFSLGAGLEGDNFGVAVYALAVEANRVYVGGAFISAGGSPTNNLAMWDGTNWQTFNCGMEDKYDVVTGIAVADRDVFIAGEFESVGGVPVSRIARWDGSAWSSLGRRNPRSYWQPYVLAKSNDGLIVGLADPQSLDGGNQLNFLYEWNATTDQWSVLAGADTQGLSGPAYALAADGKGGVFVGGDFEFAGSVRANGVAHWDGIKWSALGEGINGYVQALAVAGNGDLYVGGRFTRAGDIDAYEIARWDGKDWHALGGGISHPFDPYNVQIRAIAVVGGSVYAGGYFGRAGEVTVSNLARWDIAEGAWNVEGGGTNRPVNALSVGAGGELYVGGEFSQVGNGIEAPHVARWDGATWVGLGSGTSSPVLALAYKNGMLYAGGSFSRAGEQDVSGIARWDGKTWSGLGHGVSHGSGGVYALALSRNGVYAAGGFRRAILGEKTVKVNRIARWDGERWHALSGGGVGGYSLNALAVVGSDLYVGGEFNFVSQPPDDTLGWMEAGGIPASGIALYAQAQDLATAEELPLPEDFVLYGSYPNPFTETTTIHYSLRLPQQVVLKVYDVLGRVVKIMEEGRQPAGEYRIELDAPGLPSGVYLCHLHAGGRVQTVSMVRVR